ncbi:MAG: GNAT family N-acetyltransferase [Phycisphaerales bacterium]|nr:GNAT family N-acetyltransferase [Phycisphaerales bacterium]MCB9835321.1 GNAT family N-acetyltransferase [Phycisphaera sp.]
MPTAFKLRAEDADRYWLIRQTMLEDTPWAFASDPESDNAREPSAFVERISKPYFAILATEDETGALTAAAGVVRRPRKKLWHRAEIWGVYVRADCRKKGLGAVVVQAAIDEGLGWPGVDSVALSVSVRSEAIRLYQRLGFEVWGREPDCLRLDGVSYDEYHLILQRNAAIRAWPEDSERS